MTFQTHVNVYPGIGVAGARASQNPIAAVVAGQLGLVAGAGGTTVGKFAWNTYPTAGGPGQANSQCLTGLVPDGFVSNVQQALITTWLGEDSMVVPAGYPIVEMEIGDFFANNPYAEAVIGQKVFVNLFSGDVLGGTAGSFPTNEIGTAAVIGSATTSLTNPYQVTISSLTSGVLEPGQQVFGLSTTQRVYIDNLGTWNGTTGYIVINTPVTAAQTAVALTTTTPSGAGGGAIVASGNPGVTLTIASIVAGSQVLPGQFVQPGSGIPSGTYIASLGTFNGATGTVVLSQAITATITSATLTLSAFIETPWKILSAANVGDLVKIGIRP
jgi:hypothetical protein